MEEQSYAKHTKTVPLFHGVLFALLLAALAGSTANLYFALNDGKGRLIATILLLFSLALILASFFARTFALKAQDRAIRAEENFRHFVITGKPLDRRLTVKQIVGLRFASDAELPELARKAADESLSLDAIKKSVKNWRVDSDRL
jgi:hypothetical protein